MNATRRQIVSSLPVYLLFGVVAAPTATSQGTAKTVHGEQALAAPNETKPASFFWGDYDGDGFDDAFVIAPSGHAQLLRNLGDGTLAETTAQAGLSGLVAPTFASWSDMDLDGDLDIFIGTATGPSGLFLNEGQGTFIEIAALAGLTHTGADEHGGWIDYDQDGLPDLHVRTQFESLLYRNLGEAVFERVELGLAPIAPGEVTPVATKGVVAAVATTSESTPADATVDTTSPAQPAPNAAAPGKAGKGRSVSATRSALVPTGVPTGEVAGATGSTEAAGASPLMAVIPCANKLKDQSGPGCLEASSAPQLGKLYPISANLFVSSIGRVGIGTTSPTAKLDVAGTTRTTDIDLTDSLYKGGALFMHTKGGVGNVVLGYGALAAVTTGAGNTAVGLQALRDNTSGNLNNAVGALALYSNTTGNQNNAVGENALRANTTGSYNTALGVSAMLANTTGYRNVAIGGYSMLLNADGHHNIAVGQAAMYSNTSGDSNIAIGDSALPNNTTGIENIAIGRTAMFYTTTGSNMVAVGRQALAFNSTGYDNVAVGDRALRASTTASYNAALGTEALYANTTGECNTGVGDRALSYNTTGYRNVAVGSNALNFNTTGYRNTALGARALRLTTGNGNIGLGYNAGQSQTTGSNNIAIGHVGVAAETTTTRIGTSQTRAFIAGIHGKTTGGTAIAVLIDSAGQLGTVSSSRRFKEDIRDMGDATDKLLELRPVVFRYKPEVQSGERPIEYGLIAEEVAEIFPDLVVYDDEGLPFTVKYHLLGSMLLNELKKERARNDNQANEIAGLRSEMAAMKEQVVAMSNAASPSF